MNPKITVVFPCGGRAERFGNTFKPFLRIGDLTFIEKAYEPFRKWESMIEAVRIIITKQQEQDHNVTERLQTLFPKTTVKVSILEKETEGPLQTFTDGFIKNNHNLSAPFIVCDCDHSINVDELFEQILNKNASQIIIPTWNITEEIQHNWSKILLKNKKIEKFVNKEDVDFNEYTVKGIIGCIYFDSAHIFTDINNEYHNFYEIISEQFRKGAKITLSDAPNAYFFGDPTMLSDCVEKRRNECSIFCDIDGVLLKHNDHSNSNIDTNICLQGYKTLKELNANNHKIILTTARNEKYRNEVQSLLKAKNIYYDELIMSLPSGPRVLINDHKPSKPFTIQANSYEVVRNRGLDGFDIEKIVSDNKIKVIKDLSANSFAKTYLIEKDGNKFVRKQVLKDAGQKHIDILKRQKRDLERFNFLVNGICPVTYEERESNLDYYYDMEYLPKYKMLSEADCYNTKVRVLSDVLKTLNDNVYSFSKKINGPEWMEQFLNEKIYAKFDNFKLQGQEFDVIIESKEFFINKQKYVGLRQLLKMLPMSELYPNSISVVHGDLTYENIMYNPDDLSAKLIDMDGSRLFDAKELDLGKLSQSIYARYNLWKNMDSNQLVSNFNIKEKSFDANASFFDISEAVMPSNLIQYWQPILMQSEDIIRKKIYFYMSTYFIRFVPFRMQIDKDHGVFALLMATVWLNKLLKIQGK